MSSTPDEITIEYEESGQILIKELDKVILSKGAWTTILFRYQELDAETGEYGPDKYAIRRYQKSGGEYRQKSKFNISSAEQARRFVAACRYPPLGVRSFGPARGLLYGGSDYPQHANDEILTLAMIETREGLADLDAILDTEGLDGVFIGPNDLSLTLTGSASAESQHPEMLAAIERVIHCCRQQQKIAGIFCTSGAAAAARIAQGFQFVTPANDVMQLGRASREAIALARGNAIPTTGASGH